MKRQYSREELSKINQYDAKDARDKKIAERQARVEAEKMELDRINRELEFTKMRENNQKIQKMNEMREEYNQFIVSKQQIKEENKRNTRSKKESEVTGTFKIGGENREIKKRTYEDVTEGLLLNPTRQPPNSSQRGRREEPVESEMKSNMPSRGKSQGFNIINHSAYNTDNKEGNLNFEYRTGKKMPNINNNNIDSISGKFNSNVNSYTPKEIEGIENLENFHRHYDINPNNRPMIFSDKNEGSDSKVKKYYEEYLKKKEEEEKIQRNDDYYNEYNNQYNNYAHEADIKYEKQRIENINQMDHINDLHVKIIFKILKIII
jgi:hypothetical protein